jgi:hypothetical protein
MLEHSEGHGCRNEESRFDFHAGTQAVLVRHLKPR